MHRVGNNCSHLLLFHRCRAQGAVCLQQATMLQRAANSATTPQCYSATVLQQAAILVQICLKSRLAETLTKTMLYKLNLTSFRLRLYIYFFWLQATVLQQAANSATALQCYSATATPLTLWPTDTARPPRSKDCKLSIGPQLVS